MNDSRRTILITGASTGIGRAAAEGLARAGAHLYLACRSESKTRPVIEELRRAAPLARVEFLPLDLADLDSVRACAAAFLSRNEPLHVLINNAGVAGYHGRTRQGFEVAFGTNYLGHFLLTQLLLPRLRESAPARIVHVASDSHYDCKQLDWEALQKPTRSVTAMKEYEVSKLCNVLFARESSRHWGALGVRSYAVDPGTVASDIWRKIPWPVRTWMKRGMLSTEEGARSTVHCALADSVAAQDGLYYTQSCDVKEPSKLACDDELARTLWRKSLVWSGLPAAP